METAGEGSDLEIVGDAAGLEIPDEAPDLEAVDDAPGDDRDRDAPMLTATRLPFLLPESPRGLVRADWLREVWKSLGPPVTTRSRVVCGKPGERGGIGPAASRPRSCRVRGLFERTIPSVGIFVARLDPVFVRLPRAILFGAEKITSSRFER